MALYIATDRAEWVASLQDGSWVEFPAEVNGWEKRRAARGLDPLTLREVPAKLAFNTGFPEAERRVA
jgi:hypothetical protein